MKQNISFHIGMENISVDILMVNLGPHFGCFGTSCIFMLTLSLLVLKQSIFTFIPYLWDSHILTLKDWGYQNVKLFLLNYVIIYYAIYANVPNTDSILAGCKFHILEWMYIYCHKLYTWYLDFMSSGQYKLCLKNSKKQLFFQELFEKVKWNFFFYKIVLFVPSVFYTQSIHYKLAIMNFPILCKFSEYNAVISKWYTCTGQVIILLWLLEKNYGWTLPLKGWISRY
jgi:hypothetical protein